MFSLTVISLINDFSRRSLLDGRVCRLPTIIVRPGAPTAAASSFASGIVREPLQGKESVLPVDESLPMWVCSPKTVVKNLVYALSIAKEKFGLYRTVNLPGITVTVGDILEALEAVGGKEKRALVKREKDDKTEAIVLYVFSRVVEKVQLIWVIVAGRHTSTSRKLSPWAFTMIKH
jgi:nucleoside-diphosphate-sugar epimerase